MNDECTAKFQELKLGKKIKYIIFTLNKEKTEIVVEKVSLGGDYDDFIEDLPALECRWGVFDLEYKMEGEGEGKRNKLIFVSWCVLIKSFLFYFFFVNCFCFFFPSLLHSCAYLGLAIACDS